MHPHSASIAGILPSCTIQQASRHANGAGYETAFGSVPSRYEEWNSVPERTYTRASDASGRPAVTSLTPSASWALYRAPAADTETPWPGQAH